MKLNFLGQQKNQNKQSSNKETALDVGGWIDNVLFKFKSPTDQKGEDAFGFYFEQVFTSTAGSNKYAA